MNTKKSETTKKKSWKTPKLICADIKKSTMTGQGGFKMGVENIVYFS